MDTIGVLLKAKKVLGRLRKIEVVAIDEKDAIGHWARLPKNATLARRSSPLSFVGLAPRTAAPVCSSPL